MEGTTGQFSTLTGMEGDVSVLATKKQNQIFPLPHPSHVFEEDESTMVMGSAEYIRAIT